MDNIIVACFFDLVYIYRKRVLMHLLYKRIGKLLGK